MGELCKFGEKRGQERIIIDPALLATEFEPKCVICNETGRVYRTAQDAADDNGINWMRMKKHLTGELPYLRCHPRKTFAYTDLQLDELGKVIREEESEEDEE